MPVDKTQLMELARDKMNAALNLYKVNKDEAVKNKAIDDTTEFKDAIGEAGLEDKTRPVTDLFTFDIPMVKYLTLEYIYKHGKMPSAQPPPQVDVVEPEWITQSSHLGDFNFDDEVVSILEFIDTSGVVNDITLSGDLPSGVSFDKTARTIYGYIEDEQSGSYEFTITLHTSTGNKYPITLTMNTIVSSVSVEWDTDPDLGVYSAGSVLNKNITASVLEEQ